MSDLNLSLILRLVDKATGPAREAMRRVQKIGGGAQEFGGKQVAWADKQIEKNKAVRSSLMGQTAELMAMGAALYGLTEPAIQAEKRMAAISKFVEFKGVDGLKLLQKDIRDLVTTGGLSMTADGISEIVAAAGQMGVVNENLPDDEKRRQLLQFATDAGKMAVAFDLSAEQAGKALARWRQNFHLTHDEAMLLGDAINVLGNTMITNEADIVEVMQRQGVEAIRSGLGEKEGAALAATILSGGAAPEVAATGMKNFLGALTDGENATKKVRNAYSELGMDPEQVAVSMQKDASGTILEVIKALEGVEDHRRQSVAKALFGKEAWEAIGPLVANRKLLEEALGKVEDDVEILGKMNEEYQRQAATTEANRTIFLNHIKALSVVVGTQLLPMLNEMMATVAPLIMQAMEWIEANPELAKTLGWVAVSLIGLKAASLALRWPLVLLTGSVLRTWRAFGFALQGVGWLTRAFSKLGAMRLLPNFGPALGAFAGFRKGGTASINGLAASVASRTAAMNRNLSNMKWNAIGAAGMMWWALKQVPDDPDKAAKWRTDNSVKLEKSLERIPGLSHIIKGYEKVFKKVHGHRPERQTERLMTPEQQKAIGTVRSFARRDGLPTPERLEEARQAAAALKAEMAALQSKLDALGEAPSVYDFGSPEYEATKQQLAATQRDLQAVETELAKDEAAAAELSAALKLLSDTEVTPVINTRSIDAALTKIDRMNARLRNMSNSAPTAPTTRTSGARALGGPVRAGFAYKINELGEEVFVPGMSGRVVNARDAKSLLDGTGFSIAAAAPVGRSLKQAAQSARVSFGDIHITVPGGGDPASIVQHVKRALKDAMRDAGVDLHDGGAYAS